MALKGHPEADLAEPLPRARAWGVLTDDDETAQVVRFVVADRSVSFPFHAFKRWEFNPGTTDMSSVPARPTRWSPPRWN